ncbi:MAG: hypothetical protein GF398_09990 [Chitinivibrionales bacterium]|nr:hypothetical protein [Chitinivibrionales bacterium]
MYRLYIHHNLFADMNILVVCAAVLSGLCGEARAQEQAIPLSGKLPAVVKQADKPYLVTADIEVAPGENVTIEPGVVFLFKNFTGLNVHGVLLARGDEKRPVIFTSENDNKHNPRAQIEAAQYDWNGIVVNRNAVGTEFRFCAVKYSLYGINSITRHIVIENCAFHLNGKSDLVIEGVKQNVDEIPYSHAHGNEKRQAGIKKAAQSGTEADTAAASKNSIIGLRVSLITLALAGGAIAAYQTPEFTDAYRYLKDISDPDDQNLSSYTNKDWQDAKEEKDKNLSLMAAGYGLALLSATGFMITLKF